MKLSHLFAQNHPVVDLRSQCLALIGCSVSFDGDACVVALDVDFGWVDCMTITDDDIQDVHASDDKLTITVTLTKGAVLTFVLFSSVDEVNKQRGITG